MASDIPNTQRARLATAGARAATTESLAGSNGHRAVSNVMFHAVMLLALAIAIGAIASMLIFAFVEGRGRLDLNLITQVPSTVSPETAGYRPAILGTIMIIVGVIVLIVPLGIGAAVYLEEYADKSRRVNRLIELNIQNLAGVPSIVFGILGMAFIARGPLSLGFVAAAGSLTIAMLVLPTVILASREALRAVPSSIRDGSLALGATQWQTTSRHVLPAAFAGILTGVILAVARAIGEAAPLLLVGAVTFTRYNPNLFSDTYTALPVLIYNYAGRARPEFQELAMAGAIIMIALAVLMNSFAIWLRNRFEQRW